MKARLTRTFVTIVVLAAMALSTGAGIRWGMTSSVVTPPSVEEPVPVDELAG